MVKLPFGNTLLGRPGSEKEMIIIRQLPAYLMRRFSLLNYFSSLKQIYMKKILLIFDGAHFSEGAYNFARQLNEKSPVLLTGVFLPQVSYDYLWGFANAATGPLFVPFVEEEIGGIINQNISRFEEDCRKDNIDFRVHKDFYEFALPELKRESRFADLIILGSETFYKNLGSAEAYEYFKEAVHAAECPVIVVPEKFDFPKNNILAYDGSESSVYAIKQFAYLFPELTDNETLLVYARAREEELPEEFNIEELAARHFSNLTLSKLEIDPKKYFATWIKDRKEAILVSGAFGRSAFSEWLRESFVSGVITDHKLPVFIAHL